MTTILECMQVVCILLKGSRRRLNERGLPPPSYVRPRAIKRLRAAPLMSFNPPRRRLKTAQNVEDNLFYVDAKQCFGESQLILYLIITD